MCTYQNISGATFGNFLNDNWEENLWDNVLSPSSNTSNTSSSYSQVSDAAVQTNFRKKSSFPSTSQNNYQTETASSYQNVESASMLPPTWENSTSQIPQTYSNMSTYFSTFNPTSEFQEVSMQEGPLKNFSQNLTGKRKSHQARINLIPTGNGNFKAIVKRKRKRTIFTTEQLQVLEEVFSKKPYVTRDERQLLVQQLQVNDKSVKIWFQNRRLKNKREDQEIQDDNQCSIFDRLDTVESKINERTDEFGYVTLDDKIMTDLVNVIDDYFSSNVSPIQCKREIGNSPIYEPISPASTSDYSCEENESTWQHYGPSDIVQELIDLESIITS